MKTQPASGVTPLQRLYDRLEFLGRVLAILCCLWIGVVGSMLTQEATPDLIPNHRSPAVQEQIGRCEGTFALRFSCTETILVKGGQDGALAIAQRLAAVLLLPTVAWGMWHAVMEKARRLRSDNPSVPQALGHPALQPHSPHHPTIHAAE